MTEGTAPVVGETEINDVTAGLNSAQEQAVLHGADGNAGPLIVLAGPGTGKTRVIVHRIARIIQGGAEPESVLAVTFTNKAAAQLRERLGEMIGPAGAARVQASTFHALGLRIVRRFASDLGLPPMRADAPIVDSAQRTRLLREAIATQGLFASRRAAGLDALVELVARAMTELANLGKSPEECASFIETWRTRIGSGQDSAGKAFADELAVQAEGARLAEFEEIARAYAWYAAECRKRGWLGFDDLIMLPIRLLRTIPRAAAMLRSEFRHALVDEFQDVNAAQIELLALLFPPQPAPGASPSGPDLCVVGDDDQAIFGFRGSDDAAFAKFAERWPGARRITLSENYRSECCVIDAANRTISLALSRFEPDKRVERAGTLAASPPAPGAGVECVELANDKEDGAAIATMILADRAASAAGGARPRHWDQYAVVCRSNGDISRVAAEFELEGIPARATHGDALCEDEGVQDVLAWITLLTNPQATWAARRLLVRPPLAADPQAVMALERDYRARVSIPADPGRPRVADAGGYLDWLVHTAAENPALRDPTRRLVAWHRELSEFVSNACAADTIARIIGLTDAAHADLLPARLRARRVTALVELVRFARLIQPRLEVPGDLREFHSYWEDLTAEDRSLRAAAGIEDRTEQEEAGHADEAEADGPAVAVLTAHKAKGLEWDTVFVPRVSPQYGFGKTRRDAEEILPAGLYPEARPDAVTLQGAEERRVFYVACTRARRRLVLFAKRNKSNSKSTHFFEEFTRDPAGQALVTVRAIDDVRAAAAVALGRELPPRAAGQSEFGGDALEHARQAARLAAAEALTLVDRADAGPADLEAAAGRLRGAAARLAVVSHIAAHRAPPPWVAGDAVLEGYAQGLLSALRLDERAASEAPRPPLSLSFTAINRYLNCPGCYWLYEVKRLYEPERAPTALGKAVHAALEHFYGAVREAEAAGDDAPTLDTLLRLGREQFIAHWPRGVELDTIELEQALAQLRLAHGRLHDRDGQVLEIERRVEWEYECAGDATDGNGNGAPGKSGGRHRFSAKIDRIDQVTLPDGRAGFRVIDYKTGKDFGKFREPKPDDLQLGIYALALPHIIPGVDLDAVTAEYWLLSTGIRGSIPMASLRLDRVRAKIDAAVADILAGRFDPNPDCTGDCRLFRRRAPDPVPHPAGS